MRTRELKATADNFKYVMGNGSEDVLKSVRGILKVFARVIRKEKANGPDDGETYAKSTVARSKGGVE